MNDRKVNECEDITLPQEIDFQEIDFQESKKQPIKTPLKRELIKGPSVTVVDEGTEIFKYDPQKHGYEDLTNTYRVVKTVFFLFFMYCALRFFYEAMQWNWYESKGAFFIF